MAEAEKEVGAAVEAAKPAVVGLTDKVAETVEKSVDGLLSKGIEEAKSLLHNVEESKGQIASEASEAASSLIHASASADSAPPVKEAERTRELPASTETQPLVVSTQRAVRTTPWWQNCCGVLDVLKSSDR